MIGPTAKVHREADARWRWSRLTGHLVPADGGIRTSTWNDVVIRGNAGKPPHPKHQCDGRSELKGLLRVAAPAGLGHPSGSQDGGGAVQVPGRQTEFRRRVAQRPPV